MMTKKQKIWMWIFVAMFAIPEILWGNLLGILKISFLPIYKNIQIFTDKPTLAFLVIVSEVIGIFGIFYLFNRKSNVSNIWVKYVLNVLLSIIFLLLLISLYLSIVATQIRFP